MTTSTVDFTTPVQATNPKALGMVCSTYGMNPLSSATQGSIERALDARLIRIPAGYRNGQATTSAGGGPALNLQQLTAWYQSVGFDVEIVCGGRTSDTDLQPGDALAISRVLGSTGVTYTTPNEPNNSGHSVQDAINWANMIHGEINMPVGGPVWSYFDLGSLTSFAEGVGKGVLGAVIYHHYGMGNPPALDTPTAMSQTPTFGSEVASVVAMLKAAGLTAKVIVDEVNFSWQYNDGTQGGDNRFFTAVNTVWIASVCGHILANGGYVLPYASQNGPLGMTVEAGNTNPDNRPGSTPMPAYWGIAAFTGAHLFSHFKDTFYKVSNESDPNVETFAVNNEAGGHNVILVNKNTTGTAQHTLTVGGSSTYDVWQTNPSNPYDPPTKIAAAVAGASTIQLPLPALSVTTVVFTTPVTTPTPTPVANTFRISAGGASVAGWSAPPAVTGGTDASNPQVATPPAGIPAALFAAERWGEQVYTLPVSGPVKVTLLFCEQYPAAQVVGGREFNILVNGGVVDTNYDVWSRAGAKVGAVAALVINAAPNAAGNVVIALSNGAVGSPFINAIMVDPNPPPAVQNLPSNATLSQAAAALNNLPVGATVPAVNAVNALFATLRQQGMIS